MRASEDSRISSRHPIIYRCIVAALLLLTCGLVVYCQAHQRGEFRQPEVHLEPQVEDTGIYLSRDESLYDGRGRPSCYGKHLVFVTRLMPLKMGDVEFERMYGKHWYGLAEDFDDPDTTYVLISEEELPDTDLDTYLEVDGIVSGYLLQPTERSSGSVSVTHPILKISSIRRGTLIDLVSPAISEDKPNQSVSDEGITFTLDAITYRSVLTVAQLSVTNDTERYVNAKGMTVTCGDGRLVYSNDNAFKYGRYFGDDSSGGPAFIGSWPTMEPGESFTATCPLDPVDPHESLRFVIELNTGDGVIRNGKLEWEARELEIAYEPKSGE